MSKRFSRRDFLKIGSLAAGSLAFNPFIPRHEEQDYGKLGRVTIREIDLRATPGDAGQIIGKRYRDQLVQIYYELEPPDAPEFYNKLWYRVWGGYIHSSYLQLVKVNYNESLRQVREAGQLAEVTVPYTQAYRFTRYEGWAREYRLYYETTHWITGIDAGPDGDPWYRLRDELLRLEYHVPCAHLRPIPDDEVTPISPDVAPGDKRIEIDIAHQTLRAYENDAMVLETKISSGVPSSIPPTNNISPDTPKGRFRIYSKMASKHMGDGNLFRGNFDLDAYELVGVPWTMFFHELQTGYALHGTYWHNNFGWQMSRGCVNMRNYEAKWLFRWANPVNEPTEVEKTGYGTRVHVF
jgi:hypothetical protein